MPTVRRRSQEVAQSPPLESGHEWAIPAAGLRRPFLASRFGNVESSILNGIRTLRIGRPSPMGKAVCHAVAAGKRKPGEMPGSLCSEDV